MRSYSYEDMYQDAAEIALRMAPKHDPSRGPLRSFLVMCAMQRVQMRMTRAAYPVGTRSNGDLGLLRYVVAVVVTDDHLGADPTDYDHAVYLAQVHGRLREIANADETHGDDALRIVLGMTTPAQSPEIPAAALYKAARKLRERLQSDRQLHTIARDAS